VEEEFMRFQSLVEGAEDEAPRFRGIVVFAEVRQGPSGETQRTPPSIDILIAETEHNLRQISLRTLGLGSNHLIDAVEIGRDLLGYDLLHSRQPVVQIDVDVILKGVDDPLAPLMQIFRCNLLLVSVLVQDVVVEAVDLLHLFGDVALEVLIRDAVGCSYGEGVGH
jgi:hypothetical protein